MRFRRQNTPWLVATGAMLGTAIVAGVASPVVIAALMGIYGGGVLLSFIQLQPRQITRELQRAPLSRRMSPQAREAVERAQRRGSYVDPDMTLLDIGLITAQTGDEGMVMRRTRTVSRDDDGVRPFIQLHVAAADADRNAVLRFEILDPRGEQIYVHEAQAYLRDGEVNLLAETQLPLAANERVKGAGDCDLRVYVDGRLLGVHSFALTLSEAERRARVGGAPATESGVAQSRREYMERRARLADEAPQQEAEDAPQSLEALMRQQSRRRDGGG